MNRAQRRKLKKVSEQHGTESFEIHKTAFSISTTVEDKKLAVGEFMIEAFKRISKISTHTILDTLKVVKANSEHFSKKPLTNQSDPYIEWYFNREWFASVIAQAMSTQRISELSQLFHDVGWNYEKALNPDFGTFSTVEEFNIENLLPGVDKCIKIQLETHGTCVIGQVWKSKSKTEWEIVDFHRGKARFELASEKTNFSIYRNEAELLQNFVRTV